MRTSAPAIKLSGLREWIISPLICPRFSLSVAKTACISSANAACRVFIFSPGTSIASQA
ncbi:Uncharacterised protein [Vibrio cholerae]|nr:Uncharacterised protein [Vibrio cholerae]